MTIVLDGEHTHNGTVYAANSVIEVPDDTGDWLVAVPKAREIVAGPAAWAAGSYAANSLVSHNGGYYVNNASAVSGDVPGVAAKWVLVSYLVSSAVSATSETIAGKAIDTVGNVYRVYVHTNPDGAKVLAVEQTPI